MFLNEKLCDLKIEKLNDHDDAFADFVPKNGR